MQMLAGTEAHNGYIQVYLDLGLIGLVLFGAMMVAGFRNAVSQGLKPDMHGLKLAFLFSIMLYNLTEAGFHALQPCGFIFLLMLLETRHAAEDKPSFDIRKTAVRFRENGATREGVAI
jgi:O-antigen ligase